MLMAIRSNQGDKKIAQANPPKEGKPPRKVTGQ